MLQNLSVESAEIKNGMVTITTPGQAGAPAVYQQVNATVTNLTPKSFSTFSASAQLPGGGSLSAKGSAGPIDFVNTAATPIDVHAACTLLMYVSLHSQYPLTRTFCRIHDIFAGAQW